MKQKHIYTQVEGEPYIFYRKLKDIKPELPNEIIRFQIFLREKFPETLKFLEENEKDFRNFLEYRELWTEITVDFSDNTMVRNIEGMLDYNENLTDLQKALLFLNEKIK